MPESVNSSRPSHPILWALVWIGVGAAALAILATLAAFGYPWLVFYGVIH